MKTIRVKVSVGLVGCDRETTFEVDDDLSEAEIEAEARDAMFDMIEWHYEEVEADDR